MRIYIVRHGQSMSSALKNYDSGDSKLTSVGIKQVSKVATRINRLPIDIIISSDYARALQTAEIIGKKVRKKYVVTTLLREEKHPSDIISKLADNSEVVEIKKRMYENRNKRKWHFSDEENFFDLKNRMIKFLGFLKRRKENNLLIISHGQAIRMLISILIFGNQLTADIFYKMRTALLLRNTGITVCDYFENQWKLVTWNDHTHLA